MGKEYSFGRMCLATLFIISEGFLYLPFGNSKKGGLISLIIALAGGVFLYLLWCFLTEKIIFLKSKRTPVNLFCTVMALLGCLLFVITAKHIGGYVENNVLTKGELFASLVAFIIVMIYILLCGEKVLTKFSVVPFFITLVFVAVLTTLAIGSFKWGYAKDVIMGKPFPVLKQSGYICIRIFASSLIYGVFSALAFSDNSKKQDVKGFIIGGILLLLAYFVPVMIFSFKTATELKYPFQAGIGVLNVGNLFTRLDGLSYFVVIFSCFVRSAVGVLTVKLCLEKIGVKHIKAVSSGIILLSAVSLFVI